MGLRERLNIRHGFLSTEGKEGGEHGKMGGEGGGGIGAHGELLCGSTCRPAGKAYMSSVPRGRASRECGGRY